jgi:hypothetical protein
LIATDVQAAGDAIRAKMDTSMGVLHVVDALDVAGHSGNPLVSVVVDNT